MNDASNYRLMNAGLMSNGRKLAAYLGDIRFELVKMARVPAFAVPVLFFPVMFYMLFGVVMAKADPSAALSTFVRMGVFGTMAPGLFGFGVSLAFEREYGLLTLKQALPTPPGSYLLARMVMAMMFAAIISVLLILIALFMAHVPLTALQAARIFVTEVLGVLPFCAIGLMVGAMISGQAAPALINIIYLPMAALSGLWIPFEYLPMPLLRDLAPIWPSYHLSQIALHALGMDSYGRVGSHYAALTGVTVLFFTLAVRKLASGGWNMLRRRSAPAGAGAGMHKAFNMLLIAASIALIIDGALGGHEKVPAATTAETAQPGTGSPVPDAGPALPAGVAAPAIALISDFDHGSDKAAYGIGWKAVGDETQHGDSVASQKLVVGGAQGSAGALEVSGTVGSAAQYPFAGTLFIPNDKPAADPNNRPDMDFSGRKTLSFYVRGDGQRYTLLFIVPRPHHDAPPPMFPFTADADWHKESFRISDMSTADLQHVQLILIGAMNPGPFRFQIDDVRIE